MPGHGQVRLRIIRAEVTDNLLRLLLYGGMGQYLPPSFHCVAGFNRASNAGKAALKISRCPAAVGCWRSAVANESRPRSIR